MLQIYVNKICMSDPERFDHMPLLISKLQRDLFDMRQSTISNLCAPDWKFGLCTRWQDFSTLASGASWETFVVMSPPQANAAWVGLQGAPARACPEVPHVFLQFNGENLVANTMLQEAAMGTWLNNSDRQHFID